MRELNSSPTRLLTREVSAPNVPAKARFISRGARGQARRAERAMETHSANRLQARQGMYPSGHAQGTTASGAVLIAGRPPPASTDPPMRSRQRFALCCASKESSAAA